MTPVRLEHAALRSQVKHSTTALPTRAFAVSKLRVWIKMKIQTNYEMSSPLDTPAWLFNEGFCVYATSIKIPYAGPGTYFY